MSEQPPCEKSFEEALAELETIVRDLEDGAIGLDEALARYEAGISLLKHCYGQLRQAEQRILQLTGTDEQGRPLLAPFEHTAAATQVSTESPKRSEGSAKRRPPERRAD